MEERTRLINAIEDLDDPLENIVLRLMYVNGYSWQETKRELNYSHATIQRARAKAIEHLVIKDEPTFNK
jgi:sigma-70, region 4 family